MGQSRCGGDRVPPDQWCSTGGPEIALLKRRRFPRLEPAHLPVPTVPLLPHSKTLALFSLALRFYFWIRELQNLLRRELFFSSLRRVCAFFFFFLSLINGGRGVFGFWIGWDSGDGVVSNIYICDTLQLFSSHIFVLNIHSRITLRSHIFLACLRGVVSLNFKIRRLVEHVSARVSVPRTNLNYG